MKRLKRHPLDPILLQKVMRLERAQAAALEVGDIDTAEAIDAELAEIWGIGVEEEQ